MMVVVVVVVMMVWVVVTTSAPIVCSSVNGRRTNRRLSVVVITTKVEQKSAPQYIELRACRPQTSQLCLPYGNIIKNKKNKFFFKTINAEDPFPVVISKQF